MRPLFFTGVKRFQEVTVQMPHHFVRKATLFGGPKEIPQGKDPSDARQI